MKYLALTIGGKQITAPGGIPSGGLDKTQQILIVGIEYLMIIAILLSLFYIIFGGLRWIQSGGNQQNIEAARRHIVMAIAGLVLALCAFIIVGIIGSTLGINLLNLE